VRTHLAFGFRLVQSEFWKQNWHPLPYQQKGAPFTSTAQYGCAPGQFSGARAVQLGVMWLARSVQLSTRGQVPGAVGAGVGTGSFGVGWLVGLRVIFSIGFFVGFILIIIIVVIIIVGGHILPLILRFPIRHILAPSPLPLASREVAARPTATCATAEGKRKTATTGRRTKARAAQAIPILISWRRTVLMLCKAPAAATNARPLSGRQA
jgi:hypothetical protein